MLLMWNIIFMYFVPHVGEQDLDIKKYKKRLRDLNEPVTDSEDEDE